MGVERSWEVCLYSDFTDYQVWCKKFSSLRRAQRFMRKALYRHETFYCATISGEEDSSFQVFYWNGKRIITWDKPWALSRRQAMNLLREEG